MKFVCTESSDEEEPEMKLGSEGRTEKIGLNEREESMGRECTGGKIKCRRAPKSSGNDARAEAAAARLYLILMCNLNMVLIKPMC